MGESYWLIERDDDGYPVRMVWVDPATITVVETDDGVAYVEGVTHG